MNAPVNKDSTMVAVASVASDLSEVADIAWEVTLASKNAMFIAAHAGEKARGFQPITGFIDKIAGQTTAGVKNISKRALEVSHLAVEELRVKDAVTRFAASQRLARKAPHLDSLNAAAKALVEHHEAVNQKLQRSNQALLDLLENLDEGMRAASAIAAVCRIEASRAAEFRTNLTAVSDNLDKAAIQIKNMVAQSRRRLSHMKVGSKHPGAELVTNYVLRTPAKEARRNARNYPVRRDSQVAGIRARSG